MTAVGTETLWRQFHGELHAFVLRRVGAEDVASDLIQAAFLRVHKRLRAGEEPQRPRAWLYQIVRNLIVDVHRHEQRQHRLVESVARVATLTATPEEDPDVAAFVAQSLPVFIRALDPPYRDALVMTELEGLTQAEAAQRAGVSLSGMKSRVQRGRKQVLEALKRCCEFEVDVRGRMVECASRSDHECC